MQGKETRKRGSVAEAALRMLCVFRLEGVWQLDGKLFCSVDNEYK